MTRYFRKYNFPSIILKQGNIYSEHLERTVLIDTYTPRLPQKAQSQLPIFIFNDGQILRDMDISRLLRKLLRNKKIQPCIIIGIHSNENRNHELGTTQYLESEGHGILAQAYQDFIIQELLPLLKTTHNTGHFSIAGFSLGGLSALDLCLNHPNIFRSVGVFSGALWWRDYPFIPSQPNANLIIPRKINALKQTPPNQFWFQTGTLDEKNDRDHNGIIDVIDDTLRTIQALREKGVPKKHIAYVEVKGGRHDWQTWKKAMPYFLGY